MASWHFHSHLSLVLQSAAGIPPVYRAAFHLGCFAPDLVSRWEDKGRSHFLVPTLGLPVFWHRLRRFGAWSRDRALRSPAHRWFYLGYGVHLLTDRIWVRTCLDPFLVKSFPRTTYSPRMIRAYYADMVAADSYHRRKDGTGSYAASVSLLAAAPRRLLPRFLVPGEVETLVGLLDRTRDFASAECRTRLLSWRNVSRFLRLARRECEAYLSKEGGPSAPGLRRR